MDFAQNLNGFENMEPQSLWERVHSDKQKFQVCRFSEFWPTLAQILNGFRFESGQGVMDKVVL